MPGHSLGKNDVGDHILQNYLGLLIQLDPSSHRSRLTAARISGSLSGMMNVSEEVRTIGGGFMTRSFSGATNSCRRLSVDRRCRPVLRMPMSNHPMSRHQLGKREISAKGEPKPILSPRVTRVSQISRDYNHAQAKQSSGLPDLTAVVRNLCYVRHFKLVTRYTAHVHLSISI